MVKPFASTAIKRRLSLASNSNPLHQDEDEEDFGELLSSLENERHAALFDTLANTVIKQVLFQTRKALELDGELEVSPSMLGDIINKILILGKDEPYGVRGGNLVVLFSPSPVAVANTQLRVGSFPVDNTKVPTFDLNLVLYPLSNTKTKVSNLMRRLGGLPERVTVEKYVISKKKLYRSDSTSELMT